MWVDAADRELIKSDLDHNVVVEAAAGTGKTTALVDRMIAVLASGAGVERMVAVTFTEKAAGELKLRLRAGLEKARQEASVTDPARDHLERALTRLEEAQVGTIHGFCADLLRERSVEARVDPQFETLTETTAPQVFARAFDLWFQDMLSDPPPGVRRALRRQAGIRGKDEDPVARLRQAAWTLAEWRTFPEPWRLDRFDRRGQIDALVRDLSAFAELSEGCGQPERDRVFKDAAAFRDLRDRITLAEAVRPRDHDGIEAALVDLARRRRELERSKGSGKTYGEGISREEVLEQRTALLDALDAFHKQADASLAALLHRELAGSLERYELAKQRSGHLDFVDLLVKARDLVRSDAEVRREFQDRFTHLFVDEFQDTDPIQAEILMLLTADDPTVTDWREVRVTPGKLFLVGDPKQSIYRFRGADVGIYLEVKERLIEQGARLAQLTTSFRATPAIQAAVNASFPALMTGDPETHQAEYVPLAPARSDGPDQPAVVALPAPHPLGYRGQVTKKAVEGCLPDAVAAFVSWVLTESGWTVTEGDDPERRVPVAARHVCLLFRRFYGIFEGDITRGYVDALEARSVPHLLVGGRSYHDREEIETMRTALSAIEWPDDELSVFATLRGSLFAVSDDALLEYRRERRLHPFRPRADDLPEELEPVASALRVLARLHRRRNERPIADTLSALLEATRAHAGLALRPAGEQALANVLHLAEQSRAYEEAGGISFRGFVEQLLAEAEAGNTAEAPILEDGSEGVRVMTVHKAKGLEFPIVILCDMTCKIALGAAGRHVNPERTLCVGRIAGWSPVELLENEARERARDQAEGVRLAYVAATRARDVLVVPAIGSGPGWFGDPFMRLDDAGWVSPLNAAIYPPDRRQWGEAEPVPGMVGEWGKTSVLFRGDEAGFDTPSVRPGWHRFGEHGVAWWDPARLELTHERVAGVRAEHLIHKDTDPAVVASDGLRYEQWRMRRDQIVEKAALPRLTVRTATDLAAGRVGPPSDGDPDTRPVEVVDARGEGARPAGIRFGALVHAVLATVPLDADQPRVERTSELQARILGSPPSETRAAARAVERVLSHPILERAARAAARGACRRETPVTLRARDGTLVDGVVDLAFLEDDAWTVVDFKTDREIEAGLDAYLTQVALYTEAVAAATGKVATGILMRV